MLNFLQRFSPRQEPRLNPKNDSPRPFAVLQTAISSSIKRLRAQNQVALCARVVFGLETKKIIKICSLTPPTACESERGPPQDHQELNSSNEVRVTLLVNERDIIPQTRHQTRSPPSNDSLYDKSTVSPTTARARKALAIDEELATRAIPTRIYAHKSCAHAYGYDARARSLTIG